MLKQIIIARRDLKMSPGKLAAQVSHASMAAITQFMYPSELSNTKRAMALEINDQTKDIHEWLFGSSFTKVVLGVNSEEEMIRLKESLSELNPICIVDSGRTELNGHNLTCIGLPPMRADIVDGYTGYLTLY